MPIGMVLLINTKGNEKHKENHIQNELSNNCPRLGFVPIILIVICHKPDTQLYQLLKRLGPNVTLNVLDRMSIMHHKFIHLPL